MGISWLALNESASAAAHLIEAAEHMHPPFLVWTESRDASQKPSLKDEGCYNFLTGAGGFTQSLLYGYGGMRIRSDGLHFQPQLPPGATRLVLRGVAFLGAKLRIEADSAAVNLCL